MLEEYEKLHLSFFQCLASRGEKVVQSCWSTPLQVSAGGDKRHARSAALFCWNILFFRKFAPCVYPAV